MPNPDLLLKKTMSVELKREEIFYVHRITIGHLKDRCNKYEFIKGTCATLPLTTFDLAEIDERLLLNDYVGDIKLILPIAKNNYSDYRQTIKDINKSSSIIAPHMRIGAAQELMWQHAHDSFAPDTGVTVYYETKKQNVFIHIDPCRINDMTIDAQSFVHIISIPKIFN